MLLHQLSRITCVSFKAAKSNWFISAHTAYRKAINTDHRNAEIEKAN
ncbi:MAG: hypothetical protein AAFR23_03270 [Pseudomonadota bacterium]